MPKLAGESSSCDRTGFVIPRTPAALPCLCTLYADRSRACNLLFCIGDRATATALLEADGASSSSDRPNGTVRLMVPPPPVAPNPDLSSDEWASDAEWQRDGYGTDIVDTSAQSSSCDWFWHDIGRSSGSGKRSRWVMGLDQAEATREYLRRRR